MKRWFCSFIFMLTASTAVAQLYRPVNSKNAVKFSIKNFGLTVTGSLADLSGNIQFKTDSLANAYIRLTVAAATINTGNTTRDKHLVGAEYFNAAAYPVLTFASQTITRAAGGSFLAEGLITIKAVTKKIIIPFTATPIAGGYRFSGTCKINRLHFKVGASSWVLGDEVTISFNINTVK
jgi:polyisoprenoid-binding protein YceI